MTEMCDFKVQKLNRISFNFLPSFNLLYYFFTNFYPILFKINSIFSENLKNSGRLFFITRKSTSHNHLKVFSRCHRNQRHTFFNIPILNKIWQFEALLEFKKPFQIATNNLDTLLCSVPWIRPNCLATYYFKQKRERFEGYPGNYKLTCFDIYTFYTKTQQFKAHHKILS